MPAHQNVIAVFPRSWSTIRTNLASLQALFEGSIGQIKTLCVQNLSSRSEMDFPLQDGLVAATIPEVSDQEILALYPDEDTKQGCVLMFRAGAHDVIQLSVERHSPPVDWLGRVWGIVRTEASAVLVGEELEVDEDQLKKLFQFRAIPADLDLCDAAVVGSSDVGAMADGQGPWYGGQLLLPAGAQRA